MEGTHCDGNGGWTRVAFVNMSETGSYHVYNMTTSLTLAYVGFIMEHIIMVVTLLSSLLMVSTIPRYVVE